MCVLDHNKTHAADVLHAVSFLLFEIIPEFSHKFQTNDTAQERKVCIVTVARREGQGWREMGFHCFF